MNDTTATLNTNATATAKPKKKSRSAEFIATFIKADGSPRTMRFACTHERLNQTSGRLTVWDLENRGLRRLNLATLVGRILPASPAVAA